MNTIFRIHSVKNNNSIWYVYLQLTGEEDFQLRELSDFIRNNLGGWTKLERLAEILWRMGEYARSREVYELVLERTDQTKTMRVASLHGQLGMVCVDMSDLEAALTHQQKALELKLTYLSPDDSEIAVIYTNTGLVYWKRGNLDEALEHFQQAIDIEHKQPFPDVPNIGSRYNNIGLVLRDKGRYSEALENLHRAQELLTGSLPSTHPWVSQVCGYISGVYCLQKDYSKADEYSAKCLTMSLKSLPPKHINLALAYNARAEALEGLARYKDALEHAQNAVSIAQYNSVLSTDPDRQKYEQTLERLQDKA